MYSVIAQASGEDMKMRVKFSVLLPVVQLGVAITLISSNRFRHDSIENPSWVAPDRQVCDGLNAPAAVIRMLLVKLCDYLFTRQAWLISVLETIVFCVLVALLWYLVAIEISSMIRDGRSALTSTSGMRAVADVLLITFGISLAVAGGLVRHQFGGRPDIYANLVAAPYFVWALIIVAFYGYDLWAPRTES
jgi:hypothetical protein